MSAADHREPIVNRDLWMRAGPARYGFAVLAVAAASVLQFGLRWSGAVYSSYMLFLPAIVLVALLAGFWPGIVATLVATVGGSYFFLEPTNSFAFRGPEGIIRPFLFSVIGVLLTILTCSRNRAKQALRVSESELNRAQAVAHIGSWHYDIQHETLVLSDEAHNILGLSGKPPISPQQAREIIHPEDRERTQRAWSVAVVSGTYDEENRVLVGGQPRWVRVQGSIERDQDGRPARAVGTVQDITERKLAEARLQEYEKAIEGLDEMIFVVDRDYRYVIANRAFLNGRNMAREQLIGHSVAEMLGSEVFDKTVKPKLDECFQGKSVTYEKRYKYPALGERDFSVSYFPLGGPNGVERVAVVMEDVTEKKQTNHKLRLFRTLIDHCNDAVEVLDPETLQFLDVNERACQERGYTREEMLAMTVFDIAPDVDEAHRAKVMAIVRESGFATFQVFHRRKDGSMFPVEVNLRCVQLDRSYMIAVCRDISDRKRAEDALRESGERYRDLVEHSEDLVCTHDLEGNLLTVNPAPARILGYSVEELLKIPMRELIVPEGREEFDAYLRRLRASGGPEKGLLCVLTKGGEVRTWQYHNTLRTDGVEKPVVRGMAHDITEQRRAELALRESEEGYRNFVARSSEGIFRQDVDAPIPIDLPEEELVQRILQDSYMAECNEAMVKMYGLSSVQDFLGKRLTDFVDPNDPRNVELTRDMSVPAFACSSGSHTRPTSMGVRRFSATA